MPVSSKHPSLKEHLPVWEIVRDCVAGEWRIKSRGTKYLPQPNPQDQSPANRLRYDAYLTRAVFYNVVRRTLGGLVGQVFSREPQVVLPSRLAYLIDDVTGLGVGLVQQAKRATTYNIAMGRTGVLTDFPQRDQPISAAELNDGVIRPIMTVYDPADIINWRTVRENGRNVLTLVVLQERYVVADDGFEETYGTQYRVLRLINGEYHQIIYRNDVDDPYWYTIPLDASGRPFREIPFEFIGAEDNDPSIDGSPMYDLSSLNIAHYRNSADYEESCFLSGQPTFWFSGITPHWLDTVLKGQINVGSRTGIALPKDADAGILQVNPNILPFEAMKHKEAQMVALGARLAETRASSLTATEASINESYETSTLSAAADNVSAAFTNSLKWASMFVSSEEPQVGFDLNTEFDLIKLSANERQALIQEWVQGAITFGEMRANLRRAGIALETDDAKVMKQIMEEREMLPMLNYSEENKEDPITDETNPNNPQND